MRIDEPAAPDVSARGLRVAVVTAVFNAAITSGLKDGAVAFLDEAGAAEVLAIDVPGAFELPLIAREVARGVWERFWAQPT